MSVQQQRQPQRSFGADDTPACPNCGNRMYLTRRTPHSEHGASYERQTFTCDGCRHEIERSADNIGVAYL